MNGYATVLFALIISIASVSAGQEVPDRWQLVQAGTLLAVPGRPAVERQTIVVKNDRLDRIVSGYPSAESLDLKEAKVINLQQHFVLPGLIDMHVHLTSSRGVSLPGVDEGRDVYSMTVGIANARKTLHAGYTTVRNPGSTGWSIFALRDGIESGDLEGPRLYVAGHTIRIGTDGSSGACSSVDSCREAVRRQIAMGADFIKVYATCSGAQPCAHESAPSVFLLDELRAVVATAQTRELKVAAHAHPTAGINLALEAGVDSIEHASWLDETSYQLLVESGSYIVPTLMVKDMIRRSLGSRDSTTRTRLERSLAEHPRRVAEAFAAGVKIASGSDAGVVPHGQNARELEWYVDIGLSEMEAIVTATVNAAELLGQSDHLGRLEEGRFADMIAVPASPLENISELFNVDFVMKAGKVYRDDR